MRRGGRSATSSGAADPDDLLSGIGADLLYWMEPREALKTETGQGLSAITALAGANWAQGTDANRPSWSATGGPNGTPAIVLQSGARYIDAAVSTSNGARLGIYVIMKTTAVANSAMFSISRVASPTSVCTLVLTATPNYGTVSRFTGGVEAPAITSPAVDTSFHNFSVESLAAGNKMQIDGVNVSANFTGTTGFVAADSVIRVGATANAAGTIAGVIIVNDPLTHRATVDAYVSARWSL